MQITTRIDLRTDQVSYPSVGYIGENNKRQLKIIPPKDLAGADYFMLAFELTGGVFRPPLHFAPPISVLLGKQTTSQAQVPMTLEAYLEDGTVLGKSHMVILHFEPAVTGEAWNLPGPPGPASAPAYRHVFTETDWLQEGPEEYRITITLEEHDRGPFAFISAANIENGDGDMEGAVFGDRRTPRGDIIITSAVPVSGEIFIQKGDN